MELRETLKIMRSELDITQEELAKALNVTKKSVSRWEMGEAMPQVRLSHSIIAFAKRKGVSERCVLNLENALSGKRRNAPHVPKSKLYPIERETICKLVDDSQNAIYVADIETDEVLYVNTKAEEYAGRKFVPGEKCYEFLLGRKKQCPECPKLQMLEDKSTTYHIVSPQSGKRLLVRGRKLDWNGRKAHAQYYFEETTDLEGKDGYLKLIDGLDIGICTCFVHDNGKIEISFMSDGYYALVDSTREKRFQYDGYHGLNAVCDEDKQRVSKTAQLAAKAQKSIYMKYKVLLDNGTQKELFMRAKFVKCECGKSLYYCTIEDTNCILSGQQSGGNSNGI